MHRNNFLWLKDVKRLHLGHFCRTMVLDVGSLDVHGTVKVLFEDCFYVGVDVVKGKNVDWIGTVTKYPGRNKFDTIVCLSVLEHAKDWKEILKSCYRLLKPDGLFILCWGAEGNIEHIEGS